ncbi:MAG: flippase-like domain-containing protein [Oscillatoriales cyanobacterium RM2_1_1]|nr:flippase-like domain-containing protein [Oscillatoriales cyanobacterium RM2_1_1]
MKRLISLLISLGILALIYTKIDLDGLLEVFQGCDRLWIVISLGMVIPLTLFTAWRLQQLMPPGTHLDFGEANRLILVASTLNMVLPSKMGDVAKAYFMQERGYLSGPLALSLVVFEKACDLLSLLFWCILGLIGYPQKTALFGVMFSGITLGFISGILILSSRPFADGCFRGLRRIVPAKFRETLKSLQISWGEMHDYFWSDRQQLLKISLTSVFIWFLHLLQIWFFILALNAWTPFWASLALSPLAILAGLLPLTFAGIGTRDAALVFFYQPYFDATTAAALGLLCTSRYFLPAIGGLPFFGQSISKVRGLKKSDLSKG